MSTMIMNMAIPCNPANSPCTNFHKKNSKLWKVSFTPSPAATSLTKRCTLRCIANQISDQNSITRRSGNYNSPFWNSNYIQSLSSEYKEDKYMKRASELVLQVKMLMEKEMEGVRRLELIDTLQKLGISYHFEDEIRRILNCTYHDQHECLEKEMDLYSTALEFRLLRQHGFRVPQEVFDRFKNERGEFKGSLAEDTKGLLQLYEASFLLTEAEESLEQARKFSTNILQKKLEDGINGDDLSLMIRHALEVPLHWRNQKLNARWFIDVYGSGPDMNPIVFELAKLDFNILQATYQEELKHVLRWWEQSSLAEKMPFARDRLVECYSWGLGEISQPRCGYSRIINTKVNLFITVIDDMFDVYGTLEELQLFNNIIERWDIEAMDQLPNYMQICFLALNNFINEMAYHVLKEQGFLIIPYLRKSWIDICKQYMTEAEWYSTGYKPTLKEYINSSFFAVGGPAMLSHEFFSMTNPIEKEVVQSLFEYHNIVQCSSIILRLANDLGTSQDEMERGDIPKSVQCYMNETGADGEKAREYIRSLIHEYWKMVNKELTANSPFSRGFVRGAADLARTAQYMYQHGDGFGVQGPWIKQRILNILFEPIV